MWLQSDQFWRDLNDHMAKNSWATCQCPSHIVALKAWYTNFPTTDATKAPCKLGPLSIGVGGHQTELRVAACGAATLRFGSVRISWQPSVWGLVKGCSGNSGLVEFKMPFPSRPRSQMIKLLHLTAPRSCPCHGFCRYLGSAQHKKGATQSLRAPDRGLMQPQKLRSAPQAF